MIYLESMPAAPAPTRYRPLPTGFLLKAYLSKPHCTPPPPLRGIAEMAWQRQAEACIVASVS